MKLVVGLGNPGKKYQGTRHNVGFEVLDELARRTQAGGPKSKFSGNLVETRVDEEKLLLLYPHTYMNLSGNSVRPAFDFYKLELPDVLVVCDDFNLPVGKLRLRPQGSSGGQKGLADIVRKLGSEEVPRLRIGIGRPPGRMDAAGLDRNDAFVTLVDFHACFRKAGLRWHVISGTFLGLVREGDFLAHDNDIDVGVYASEMTIEDVVRAAQSGGFVVLDITEVMEYRIVSRLIDRRPGYIKLLHSSGVQLDVFFMHRNGNDLWQGSTVHKWVNSYYDVRPYSFKGLEVLGPADADIYLTENYGDWRTPKLDFNCAVDTPHAKVLSNAGSLSLFLTRIAYGIKAPEYASDAEATRTLLIKEGYIHDGTNRIDLRPIKA
jgi:peptidyl-tRNA hydrolase, PTH1 family